MRVFAFKAEARASVKVDRNESPLLWSRCSCGAGARLPRSHPQLGVTECAAQRGKRHAPADRACIAGTLTATAHDQVVTSITGTPINQIARPGSARTATSQGNCNADLVSGQYCRARPRFIP